MKRQFDRLTLEILWRLLLSSVDEADVARPAFSGLAIGAEYEVALIVGEDVNMKAPEFEFLWIEESGE